MLAQAPPKLYTDQEFDELVNLPENDDKILQLIAGEIVEVPSNPFASKISSIFSGEFYIFLKGKNLGHLTGEAGGYWVMNERYTPDVGYISKARQPELAKEGYNPNPPDLAVEVDFPSSYKSQEELRIKVANYLAAGTVVWLVRPDIQRVEIYAPGKAVKFAYINDVLDGGEVLPGFTLAVKDIFAP